MLLSVWTGRDVLLRSRPTTPSRTILLPSAAGAGKGPWSAAVLHAYAGDYIGAPPAGAATKLADDGRRVLGIHFQQGAIVDRFALVMEDKAK